MEVNKIDPDAAGEEDATSGSEGTDGSGEASGDRADSASAVDENGKHIDATSYAICSDRQHRIWVGTFHEVGIYNPITLPPPVITQTSFIFPTSWFLMVY